MRPDVYTTVWNNVDPAAHWRPRKAPKNMWDGNYKHKPAGTYDVDENGHIIQDSFKPAKASLAQRNRKVDPISPVKYDPWVYEFSKANTNTHVQWHDREKGDQAPVQDPRLYHAFPEEPVAVPLEEKKEEAKKKEPKAEETKEETKEAAPAEEKKDAPAKEEAKQAAPAKEEAKAAFAQNEPEKVHVLDWEKYKHRADTNKPNTRTTFYDARHGLYRQEPGQMMAQVREDGDVKRAEEAAKAAAEAPKRHEAALEKAAGAAAAGEEADKVSILEPMAYERRNNYALPFMRTTFYGQRE